jgi:hypothetical protein
MDNLTFLCDVLELKVTKQPGHKNLFAKDYVMALLLHCLGDELPDTLEELAEQIIGKAPVRTKQSAKTLEAIATLDDEARKDFKDLQQHITRREEAFSGKNLDKLGRIGGASREVLGNLTPSCLKDLQPKGGRLVWQRTAKAFQGYYPGMWPQHSCSANYGGVRTPADPAEALYIVVRFLWKAAVFFEREKEPDAPTLEACKIAAVAAQAAADAHVASKLAVVEVAGAAKTKAAPAQAAPAASAKTRAAPAQAAPAASQESRGRASAGRGRGAPAALASSQRDRASGARPKGAARGRSCG